MATPRRTVAGLNVGQQVAPSMNGGDPRARRPSETLAAPELTVTEPLFIDSRGRLSIRLGPGLKVEGGRVVIDAAWLAART